MVTNAIDGIKRVFFEVATDEKPGVVAISKGVLPALLLNSQ